MLILPYMFTKNVVDICTTCTQTQIRSQTIESPHFRRCRCCCCHLSHDKQQNARNTSAHCTWNTSARHLRQMEVTSKSENLSCNGAKGRNNICTNFLSNRDIGDGPYDLPRTFQEVTVVWLWTYASSCTFLVFWIFFHGWILSFCTWTTWHVRAMSGPCELY